MQDIIPVQLFRCGWVGGAAHPTWRGHHGAVMQARTSHARVGDSDTNDYGPLHHAQD